MPGYVAVLEDQPERAAVIRTAVAALMPAYATAFFSSESELSAWLDDHLAQTVLISLDYDLSMAGNSARRPAGTGGDLVRYLAAKPPVCPVIVHTVNVHFAPGMVGALVDSGWPVATVCPEAGTLFVGPAWVDQVRRWLDSGLIFG